MRTMLCVCLIILGGCSSSSDGSASSSSAAHVCTPLAGSSDPVELGTIVGAGRAADGTIYLVDRDAKRFVRVFIGSGKVLAQQPNAGAAESANNITIMVGTELAQTGVLWVDLANGTAAQMGYTAGAATTTKAQTSGGELTLLAPGELTGLTAENPLPPSVVWDSVSDDGTKHIVVLQSAVDENERTLFYGTADHMTEYAIVDESSGLSPQSSTELTFDINGAKVVVSLAANGAGTLGLPGQLTQNLHPAGATPTGQGLTYFCGQ